VSWNRRALCAQFWGPFAGCKAIGVTPEDVKHGIVNKIPDNFNTLPSTLPAYN